MKRIIVAGKGGAGKTTVASLLITDLVETKPNSKILIIDADPSSNLHLNFGFNPNSLPIGIIDDIFVDSKKKPSDKEISDALFKKCVSKQTISKVNIDYAFLGHHVKNSCLCGYNNALNYILLGIMNKEFKDNNKTPYDFIVIDREAGIEHLNRSVYGNQNDHLIIVTWPNEEYLKVAEDINNLSDILGTTDKRTLVINNINNQNITIKDIKRFLKGTLLDNLNMILFPKLNMDSNIKKMTTKEILNKQNIPELKNLTKIIINS